jgi:hypothetical protein
MSAPVCIQNLIYENDSERLLNPLANQPNGINKPTDRLSGRVVISKFNDLAQKEQNFGLTFWLVAHGLE